MFKDYTLQTTWGRALMALVGGAFVLGVAGTFHLALLLDSIGLQTGYLSINFFVQKFPSILSAASFVVLIFGVPIFILLNRAGFRTILSFTSVGFLVPALNAAYSVIFHSTYYKVFHDLEILSGYFWVVVFELSVIPLIGTLAALTIWRIAYRRPAEDV